MAQSDSDIPIIDSRNLDDDTSSMDKDVPKESDAASIRALEKQGIFLEGAEEKPQQVKPREEVSKDLESMGVEIIPNADTEV
jgi:hypothetical protein